MDSKVTILIADDHALVREGMRMLLAREAGFELVGEASDGGEAVQLAKAMRPQVLVLDLGLPVIDGIEVARTLRREECRCRILALTARTDPASVRAALAQGMDGYVPKSGDSRELIEAIRLLAQGRPYISPSIAHVLEPEAGQMPESITPREREILVCVAEGLSSKEIASRLGISVLTVQKHRENLGRKLGTRNAAEMAAFARSYGIAD
ncbi:MAG: response regulator transcription factor [Pseudomonadota bacterium]